MLVSILSAVLKLLVSKFVCRVMANFKMRKCPSDAHDGSLMSTALPLCRANRVHVVLIMASVISVPELGYL